MASLHKRHESGYWYIWWRDDRGRQRKKSTGKKLRSEAEAVKRKWEELKDKSVSVDLHLSELIPEILRYIRKNLPRSENMYKEALNNFKRIIGDKPAKTISVLDIEDYKEKRAAEKSKKFKNKLISTHTLNKEIRTIKAAFTKAALIPLITENRISDAKQKKVSYSKKRKRFNEAELTAIFPAINKPQVLKAATIGRYTGMRLNEIIHSQLKDINFRDLTIGIYNKPDLNFETKTGEERDIPLNDELLKSILSWNDIDAEFEYSEGKIISCRILSIYDPEKFIVHKPDGSRYSKGNISRKFTEVLRELSIEGHFHCLRHTFASELAESGADIETIRDLCGHANYETTKIYMQTGNEVKRKAVNNL